MWVAPTEGGRKQKILSDDTESDLGREEGDDSEREPERARARVVCDGA